MRCPSCKRLVTGAPSKCTFCKATMPKPKLGADIGVFVASAAVAGLLALLAVFAAKWYHDQTPAGRIATEDEFARIKIGMTMAEVVTIIGAEPSRTVLKMEGGELLGGASSEAVMWDNPDGSSVGIAFQNGKVMMKNFVAEE